MNIDSYTDKSVRSFAFDSGIIYLLGGILTAAPLIIYYINMQNFGFELSQSISRFIVLIVLAVILISQLKILKKI